MPYLYDLINDHRIARIVWKIQINVRVNFISSKDTGETCTIYTQSNNVSIVQGREIQMILLKNFQSLFYMIIKKSSKQLKEAIFYLKVFIKWIINFTEYV